MLIRMLLKWFQGLAHDPADNKALYAVLNVDRRDCMGGHNADTFKIMDNIVSDIEGNSFRGERAMLRTS